MASSTVPRGFGVLAGRCFDLQSADFLCFIIRKLRLALESLSGFTNAEYLIALVDFIVALRRTKGRGRRTLRSPPSPSSGLHLIHPGNPLRRGITAAAGLGQYSQLVSGAIVNPQFRMLCSYLCSALYRSRFSWVVGLVSFVFHYWGIGRLCLRLLVVLLWIFVGFALTAIGAFLWAGNGM